MARFYVLIMSLIFAQSLAVDVRLPWASLTPGEIEVLLSRINDQPPYFV